MLSFFNLKDESILNVCIDVITCVFIDFKFFFCKYWKYKSGSSGYIIGF